MVRKTKELGLIEQKQAELDKVMEQIAENTREYQSIWRERNASAEMGDVLEAQQLEGRYYYLRDTVGKQLDRKRLEIDREVDELKAEANRLKSDMPNHTRTLSRLGGDLDALKREFQGKLADKQTEIENTEYMLKQSEERIHDLEGDVQ
ncbi:hypothetical protein RG959_23420 [Domibacillus sp. 8LH]|uniref:hypothetical protein n=1 Tax=Domibacillus sp. 8LH TaxID=3073900 RepID=UPI00316FE9C8